MVKDGGGLHRVDKKYGKKDLVKFSIQKISFGKIRCSTIVRTLLPCAEQFCWCISLTKFNKIGLLFCYLGNQGPIFANF